jgi:hypothetical protein
MDLTTLCLILLDRLGGQAVITGEDLYATRCRRLRVRPTGEANEIVATSETDDGDCCRGACGPVGTVD